LAPQQPPDSQEREGCQQNGRVFYLPGQPEAAVQGRVGFRKAAQIQVVEKMVVVKVLAAQDGQR
jgi:hypothetical protein